MKISQEYVFLIKNLYLTKQYGARRALSELPDKGWKLGSIDSQLKRSHKTCPATRQRGRPCSARSSGRPCVHCSVRRTSQKGIGQLVRFRMKLLLSIQVYTEK